MTGLVPFTAAAMASVPGSTCVDRRERRGVVCEGGGGGGRGGEERCIQRRRFGRSRQEGADAHHPGVKRDLLNPRQEPSSLAKCMKNQGLSLLAGQN
jgi:hypothetical protein